MKAKFFVPYETAKALKENGYPQAWADMYYNHLTEELLFREATPNKIVVGLRDRDDMYYSAAPTYHEVLDWLEGKGIRVFAHYYIDNGKWVYVIEDFKRLQDNAGFFHTREEALNAAILKALELI